MRGGCARQRGLTARGVVDELTNARSRVTMNPRARWTRRRPGRSRPAAEMRRSASYRRDKPGSTARRVLVVSDPFAVVFARVVAGMD